MQTLYLEPGDLVQIKSTDLPSGQFVKLQAQSTSFLDISDPKAVLENAFRNFSCLSKGDVFTFAYNDQVYEMAVLETKPDNELNAISVLETDLEVDFAPPLGYEEPKRPSGTSTPRSIQDSSVPGGILHNAGSMAQAINYSSIAPSSTAAVAGAKAVSSNFLSGGHKLNSKKGSKTSTSKSSTPAKESSANLPPLADRRTNGPQPLRLPPGQLFFGYEIKPVKRSDEKKDLDESKPKFLGQGQTLRSGTKRKDADNAGLATKVKDPESDKKATDAAQWQGNGRTLRNAPK